MERLRSSSPAVDAPSETSGSAPAHASLQRLVETVRSPGVMKKDVDALLSELERPLAEGESPRERADLLLSLLDSRHLRSMKGSQGGTVQRAAVKALMDLGHPYALEIPPEALGQAQASQGVSGRTRRSIPLAGILLALLGSASSLLYPPISLLAAVPALLAILGGWLEQRTLQRAGLWLMGALGVGWVSLALGVFTLGLRNSGDTFRGMDLILILCLLPLIQGALLWLGTHLLRHPGWHVEDKRPEPAEDAAA
jgi:hypothetical protein